MGESGKQTRLSVLHTNLTAKVSGRTKGVWTSWHCLAILHIVALVVFNALFEGPISTIGFVTLRNPHSFRRVTVVVEFSLTAHFVDHRIDVDVVLASTRPSDMICKVACQQEILAAGRTWLW